MSLTSVYFQDKRNSFHSQFTVVVSNTQVCRGPREREASLGLQDLQGLQGFQGFQGP